MRPEAWPGSVAYKKNKCIIEKFISSVKVLHKMLINSFATHRNNQSKVVDSSSSINKLYSTFIADSMSNLAHMSDRHKIITLTAP